MAAGRAVAVAAAGPVVAVDFLAAALREVGDGVENSNMAGRAPR